MINAGYVALVGNPNAGKSTLLNTLLGEKLGIVSDKPQTTRKRITGIRTDESAQMVLVDSPGFVRDEKGLNKFIKAECEDIIENSDVAVLLLNVDVDNPDFHFENIETISKLNKPKVALITKSELFPQRCIILEHKLSEFNIPSVRVSALESPEACREEFDKLIKPLLPESEGFLFDSEDYTTATVKEIAAEKIRESCFELLHQEIPYGLAVSIRRFDESGKMPMIYADIIVEKDNHKVMVIGRKGEKIKDIGTRSRMAIQDFMGEKVYLELHVSIKKKWLKDKNLLEELGYVVKH